MVVAIGATAFVLMIPREIRHRHAAMDVRMLAMRPFGASFLVMLATGAILLATTQFLPEMLQDFGDTATGARLVLSAGGLITTAMMFLVGRLSVTIQLKWLIAAGAIIIVVSMYQPTDTSADFGLWFFARSRMVPGVGLPLIFVPIIAASYVGVPQEKTDQASGMMNMARNTGGSIGISIVSSVLTHREQFHQSRLVEHAIPSRVQYQDTVGQVTHDFAAQGNALIDAHRQAIQWIGQQVETQPSFLGYMDAFFGCDCCTESGQSPVRGGAGGVGGEISIGWSGVGC